MTYRVLRVLGVGGSILFLPIGLLVASVGMFVAPVLWVGVLMRGIGGSFRYSIDKTGRELLFLPIPWRSGSVSSYSSTYWSIDGSVGWRVEFSGF